VDVAVLGRGSIEAVIRASANLEAERAVGVMSEASRRITELHVEEGDRVPSGHLLLRLQNDQQRSALARAQTEFAKAQREYDRQKNLHDRELTTDQTLNDATDELDKRKLALDDAKRELGYTEVRAPISGTITNRLVNLGDHVQIGARLFDMVDFESIVARIFVPEKNLNRLRPDLSARVRASAIRDEAFEGRVKRISPVVDPRTGTVKVTVDVGGREELRPGLYVDVELVTDVHEDALLVPKRALVYDNDQIFVYRLQPDHTVERLRLQPRLADRNWIEPLGGVAVGDTVIIAGQSGLKHGARVRLPGAEESDEEQSEAAVTDDSQANARELDGR
jgi:membrane fusion protein (multidrug efflux system)